MNLSVVKNLAAAIAPPAVMLAILGFMGKGIVDNDKVNTTQHIEIRKEQVHGDYIVRDKIDNVHDKVTNVLLKQTEQRVLLEEIRGKL